MKARRILTTCFVAVMLMMAMPIDVLAVINSPTDAQGEKQARRDRLVDISQQENQRSVAVFEDTMNTMRTCQVRTQRLLPSHGPAPGKTQARLIGLRKHALFCNPQNFSQRQEITPFPSFVSRIYYVIALRHILC